MNNPQYYGQAPVVVVPQQPTSGLAVTSMVLGIVGLFLTWCTFGIPSLLAVLFGHVALPNITRNGKSGKGMAVAGLVTGYIGLIPAIFFIVAAVVGSAGSTTP